MYSGFYKSLFQFRIFFKDLLLELEQSSKLHIYKKYLQDFSDVVELNDESEKMILFDPYTVEGGFISLNKALEYAKNVKYLFIPYS